MVIIRKSKNLLVWMSVLLIILLSGCVYFTQVHRYQTTIAFIIVSLGLYFCNGHKLSRKKTEVLFIILGCLFLNYVLNANTLTLANLRDYALIMFQLIGVFVLSCAVSLEEIQEKYVKIMECVAVISLVCYYIQLYATDYIFKIASTSLRSGYIISIFHTWGWTYVFKRNAGPFWEPGAYQGYLVIAILVILNRKHMLKNFKQLLLLTITLLTTMSTTGYIIFAILAGYSVFLYANESATSTKDRMLNAFKILVLLVFVILIIHNIINSNTITSKFMKDNGSFLTRYNDLNQGINLIISHPIIGFGIESLDLSSAEQTLGMVGNSIGIFAMLSYFGLFIGGAYLIAMFISLTKGFNNLSKFVIVIIFMIIFMSESLFTFPVYFGFLFFKSRRRYCSYESVVGL